MVYLAPKGAIFQKNPSDGLPRRVVRGETKSTATHRMWSVKGQSNQWASGTTLSLLPCDYEVAFAPVAGYVTPEP